MELNSVANSNGQLLAILAMLEECRVALIANGNPETAHLVSITALDVRMALNGIGEDDLIALCEAMELSGLAEKGL